MNEIKIDGKICSQRAISTQGGKTITTFRLNIYNGKKDGKSVYDFIDCKYFDSLNIPDKTNIVITGWLGVESWVKDGKENKRVVVYAKSVDKDISRGMVKPEPQQEEFIPDSYIPF